MVRDESHRSDYTREYQLYRLPSRRTKKAGIDKHITWHCGRHSFGTQLLNNGANIKVVSSLLGHSSLRFTEIYVRAVDEEKKKAINSMPSIDILRTYLFPLKLISTLREKKV